MMTFGLVMLATGIPMAWVAHLCRNLSAETQVPAMIWYRLGEWIVFAALILICLSAGVRLFHGFWP